MSSKQVLSSRTFNTDRYVTYHYFLVNICSWGRDVDFIIQFVIQHDGPGEDDSDLSDETDSDESEADQNPSTNPSNRQEDEESLNSADDVSGTDATEIFETGKPPEIFYPKINIFKKTWWFVNLIKFKESVTNGVFIWKMESWVWMEKISSFKRPQGMANGENGTR